MTSVFGVTSMSFDKLLTLYLSEGMMIFTALLLVVAIIVFIKSKGRKTLRTSCIVVGIYCILYLGAILALSVGFSSNHKPADPPVLVKPDSVVYAEVRETNKENAKEVSLYPGDDPIYIEPVFALVNALNAMAPYENEQDYKKNISIYDILFELENGLAVTVTVCENITYVQPVDLETAEESVGLFETTEELITACEAALESPDAVLATMSYVNEESNPPMWFGNKQINIDNLSDTTVQWLEHYNQMSTDEQMAISYVPNDLLEEIGVSFSENTDVVISQNTEVEVYQ